MPDRASVTKYAEAFAPGEDPLPTHLAGQNQELLRQFTWDIAAINIHLDGIRYFWAKELGISGPQWMILMAIGDLDRGKGVPVKDVSAMLHVDPSFVTTQSKMLEKNGFLRRIPSSEDARVVLMSLVRQGQQEDRNAVVPARGAQRFRTGGIRPERAEGHRLSHCRAQGTAGKSEPDARRGWLSFPAGCDYRHRTKGRQ